MRQQEHPLIHTFKNAHRLGAHHVAVNIETERPLAASSGFGQELVTWDLEAGKEVIRRTASGTPFNVSFLILRLCRGFNCGWFL